MSNFNVKDNKGNWVSMASMDDISNIHQVPTASSSDDGKFLRVVNGSAVWVEVPSPVGEVY